MKRKFSELLDAAQKGEEQAITELIGMYHPLIIKLSTLNDEFNEDLYNEQELETRQFEKNRRVYTLFSLGATNNSSRDISRIFAMT